jgi:hypothetical protein
MMRSAWRLPLFVCLHKGLCLYFFINYLLINEEPVREAEKMSNVIFQRFVSFVFDIVVAGLEQAKFG